MKDSSEIQQICLYDPETDTHMMVPVNHRMLIMMHEVMTENQEMSNWDAYGVVLERIRTNRENEHER